MIKTRSELKLKIREWTNIQDQPFKTVEAQDYAKEISSNIHISPHRLQNYIRSSGKVEYDKNKKTWFPKKLKKREDEECHEKIQKNTESI